MKSRLRPLLIICTAMLLLASLMVLLPLRAFSDASMTVSQPESGQPVPSVLLVSETEGSSRMYFGLRQSLAAAGLSSRLIILPQQDAPAREAALLTAAESLHQVSGRPIWLLLEGPAISSITVLSDPLVQGFILLPQKADDLNFDSVLIDQLYDEMIVLLTSDHPALQRAGSVFFEKITGEDADLFAAAAPAGPDLIDQYRSVDGRVSFSVISSLRRYWAPLDPRVSAILAEEILRLSPDYDSDAAAGYATAGQVMLTWLTRLILTGWGLLAVAALIRLYLAGPAEWSGRLRLSAAGRLSSLIWVSAAAVSLGLALLLRSRWHLPLPQIIFLLLPGAYGLINGVIAYISGRLSIPDRHDHRPDQWLLLSGLLLVTGSVGVIFIWQYLAGGAVSFHPFWLIPVAMVWNLPGVFTHRSSTDSVKTWHHLMRDVAPAILIWLPLIIWLWIASGWLTAVAAAAMLLLLDAADQVGRLTTALSGWQFPGRLLRALIIALLWLHPVILQGLMNG